MFEGFCFVSDFGYIACHSDRCYVCAITDLASSNTRTGKVTNLDFEQVGEMRYWASVLLYFNDSANILREFHLNAEFPRTDIFIRKLSVESDLV